MRKAVTFFAMAIVAAGLAGVRLQAQTLETGKWKARMLPPDSEYLDLLLNVEGAGDSLQLTLEVPSYQAQTFPVYRVRLAGDHLSFRWRLGVQLDCSVDRQEDGSFQGGCLDPRGGRGPILLIPPSVDADAVTINEEVFYADWGAYEEKKESIAESRKSPGTAVDIGGARLNVLSMGEGDVTVVLEAGLGDDLSVWRRVQQDAAAFAHVVAYDRAGLGFSKPSAMPRTPEQMATELHIMLRRAGFAPPYVLVGHAWGGFVVRRFASLYPDEAAGLVLVDPAHEKLGARWEELDAASWLAYVRGQKTFYATIRGTVHEEFEAFLRVMEEEAVPGLGSLPDIPVVVLTAMRPVEEPRWVGETLEGQEVWHDLHQEWVRQVPDGVHLVTETSGPYIHLEEPELVVQAIRDIVEAVRGGE